MAPPPPVCGSGSEATRLPGQLFFRAGRFFALDRTDPSRRRLLRLKGTPGSPSPRRAGWTSTPSSRSGRRGCISPSAGTTSPVVRRSAPIRFRRHQDVLGRARRREHSRGGEAPGLLGRAARGGRCGLPGSFTGVVRRPERARSALQGFKQVRRCVDPASPARWRPLDAAAGSRRALLRTLHDRARSLDDLVGVSGRRTDPAVDIDWSFAYQSGFPSSGGSLRSRVHGMERQDHPVHDRVPRQPAHSASTPALSSRSRRLFRPRYFVAGTRLFAAGTGTEVYLYNGSGWNRWRREMNGSVQRMEASACSRS